MRLKSVHPGVSIDTVRRETGIELVIPASVPETAPPSIEELHALRTRVDLGGRLRR
jgi:hypothetical protein